MSDLNPNDISLSPDPYYSEVHATFGDRLCAARDAAGLTQKVLASKIGVKVRTIQAWESDSVEPRANKLQMVSAMLNVSMVWLMSGLGSGTPPPDHDSFTSKNEITEILNELLTMRLAAENLLNQIAVVDSKFQKLLKKSDT